MLKGIDPVLGPELLAILRAMGHGDEIAVVDANFPASARARRLIRADGVGAAAMVKAIVALLPLDDFVDVAAFRMEVTGDPGQTPEIVAEFEQALRGEGYPGEIGALQRFAFYERAAAAYAVVATGERRFWGNLILKKGALPPEADQKGASAPGGR